MSISLKPGDLVYADRNNGRSTQLGMVVASGFFGSTSMHRVMFYPGGVEYWHEDYLYGPTEVDCYDPWGSYDYDLDNWLQVVRSYVRVPA